MLLKPELLKPERLKRYAEIVALLVKYGRSDLVDQSALVLAGGQSKELAKAPQAEDKETWLKVLPDKSVQIIDDREQQRDQ